MRASALAFPTCRQAGSRSRTGITSPGHCVIAAPILADCITNIAWSHWRLDEERWFLIPALIVADDRGAPLLCAVGRAVITPAPPWRRPACRLALVQPSAVTFPGLNVAGRHLTDLSIVSSRGRPNSTGSVP